MKEAPKKIVLLLLLTPRMLLLALRVLLGSPLLLESPRRLYQFFLPAQSRRSHPQLLRRVRTHP